MLGQASKHFYTFSSYSDIELIYYDVVIVIIDDISRQFPSRDQQTVILLTGTCYCTSLTVSSGYFPEMTI